MGWRLRIFASGPFRVLTRSCRSPTGQWLAYTTWAWVQQENILYSLHTRILFKNLRIVITTNPQKPVILCCGLHANARLWPRMAQFLCVFLLSECVFTQMSFLQKLCTSEVLSHFYSMDLFANQAKPMNLFWEYYFLKVANNIYNNKCEICIIIYITICIVLFHMHYEVKNKTNYI